MIKLINRVTLEQYLEIAEFVELQQTTDREDNTSMLWYGEEGTYDVSIEDGYIEIEVKQCTQ